MKVEKAKGRGTRRKKGVREKRGRGANVEAPAPFPLSPARRQGRSLAVVGAGRLGTALASALADVGYEVKAVVARRASHARRSAALVGTSPLALTPAQIHLIPPVRLLLVTTPDDALPRVAEQLAAALSFDTAKGAVALHASGALGAEALAPLRASGFSVGSLHPLVSVSDAVAGAERLRSAFYCVEGEGRAVRAARRLVRDLGGESFTVRPGGKPLYHAAAVMTSGHTVALFDLASRLLARCGLQERRAREVLLPLLSSTLENLSKQTPARALTGTFARADVETVRKHLAALEQEGDADALAAYVMLGMHSLRLASEAGADADRVEEIARVLGKKPRRGGGK